MTSLGTPSSRPSFSPPPSPDTSGVCYIDLYSNLNDPGSSQTQSKKLQLAYYDALSDTLQDYLKYAPQVDTFTFSDVLAWQARLASGNATYAARNTTITNGSKTYTIPINAFNKPNFAGDRNFWQTANLALQEYATKERSRFAVEDGGGILLSNGTWYVNGVAYRLADLFLILRVNQLFNNDTRTQIELTELNTRASQMRRTTAFLNYLSSLTPLNDGSTTASTVRTKMSAWLYKQTITGASDGATSTQINNALASSDFIAFAFNAFPKFANVLWGTTPFTTSGTSYPSDNTKYKSTDFSIWTTEINSWISDADSKNQTQQVALTSLNNKRAESVEALTHFIKGTLDQLSSTSRTV